MRRRAWVGLAVVVASVGAVAGCGGGGSGGSADTSTGGASTSTSAGAVLPDVPTPQLDDNNRFPKGSSVGDGLGAAPPIAASVRTAAQKVGCTVASFKSEGRTHVPPADSPSYGQQPPTSGNHFETAAKWGVYDEPIPGPVQIHNLEHGGVVIHIGEGVPAAARVGIADMWAQSPPFMVVEPGRTQAFPAAGVVVTSWQRWLVCKPYRPEMISAVRAFRDAYRGAGPEQNAALNAGQPAFPGTPAPSIPDPGADQG